MNNKENQITPSLLTGAMVSFAVMLSIKLNLYTWVVFLGWLNFFLFGQKVKQILLTFTQIVLGIGIAILLSLLSEYLGNIWEIIGIGLATFLIISSFLFLVPKIKNINIIPIYYMGMIAFYGTSTKLNLTEVFTLIGTIALGLIFALLTENINLKLRKIKV